MEGFKKHRFALDGSSNRHLVAKPALQNPTVRDSMPPFGALFSAPGGSNKLMSMNSDDLLLRPVKPYRAIVWGGLVAGVLDLAYALIAFGALHGIPLIRIPQSIASGLLGVRSFLGGWPTAALGVVLHF